MPWLRSSVNKVQTNVFCCCLVVKLWCRFTSLYNVVPGHVQDFNRFSSVNWLYHHWNSIFTVETKLFLGVSSNHLMKERIYSEVWWKQTWVFSFQCFSLCYSNTPFWNFWGPQNFGGLIFGAGVFGGFAGSPRDFFDLDFWLHLIIPVTWNPEYPPPPPLGNMCFLLLLENTTTRKRKTNC